MFSKTLISKSLRSLLNAAGRLKQLSAAALVGMLVAVSVPLVAVLLGTILGSLINTQSASSEAVPLTKYLPDIVHWLPVHLSPLGQVTVLLTVVLALLTIDAILLFVFYRQIQIAAVSFEVALIAKLRKHAKALATVRTLSAQQTALTDCLDYHLPRIRASLSRWWRTFPRHVIQLVSCVIVAALIQPALALLTVIATSLVVLVYRFIDRLRRTTLPVVRERAAQQRGALVSLSLKGPLLDSVHDEGEIDQRFAEQLAHYQRDAVRSLASSAWKTPTVILVSGLLACLFVFVVAVQILGSDASFSVAGAFTFLLCCIAAAVSASRLQRTWRELKTVETAAEELERFLAIRVEEFDGDDLKSIDRVHKQIELDHVTVQDSRGRKLLENITVDFRTGQLIGVVATQRLQANALVELLMGLGRPVSGRLMFDGTLISDLKPASVTACTHWLAADGALVAGSLRDNILNSHVVRSDVDLEGIVKAVQLTKILQELPDGQATLISPGDDRLPGDTPFRIGIGRAVARRASIVVIEEPEGRYDQPAEEQTLDAIRSLVNDTTITVVLPQRLSTLRQCDAVVMLHEHKIVDIGKHADLLQRNELYRHLNYLKYNPFRSVPPSN